MRSFSRSTPSVPQLWEDRGRSRTPRERTESTVGGGAEGNERESELYRSSASLIEEVRGAEFALGGSRNTPSVPQLWEDREGSRTPRERTEIQ